MKKDNDDWYSFLPENQNYQADFELNHQEKRNGLIQSDKKLAVGFWTDTPHITDEQVEKYSKNLPIMMQHVGKEKQVRSLFGCGIICDPENNEIEIIIANESQGKFKVVVYTQEIPNDL